MSSNATTLSKTLKWRLECMGHSLVEMMAGCLPGPLVYRLGESLGSLACTIMPRRRKMVLRNLRIAFAGEKSPTELDEMVRQTFRRTGGNLISAAHTSSLSPAALAEVIKIENFQLFQDAISQGKGVVLLLAHMGNWEVLSRMIHLFPQGTKTGAFYRPLNNLLMDQRVLDRRQSDGTRMFSKGDNPLHVSAFLRAGGVVGILADQRAGHQGDPIRFFGRQTRASPLPSLLARRAKSAVLALSVVTVEPGKWKAVFHPVELPYSTKNCMEALEHAMKSSPVDVFWFQERWRIYLKPSYTIRDWLPSDALRSQSGKHHRALLWLFDAPDDWSPPQEWNHPDVDYEVVLPAGNHRPSWLKESAVVYPAPDDGDCKSLRALIARIDLAAAIPVDYILTCNACPALVQASRKELVRLISLPPSP
jgi:Kdo2-lipid IVA lauroyltransferase/acyltransferase